jgi:hypothetical protein
LNGGEIVIFSLEYFFKLVVVNLIELSSLRSRPLPSSE